MTLSREAKAVKCAMAKLSALFVAEGFVSLHRGRLARPCEHHALVVDYRRHQQTSVVLISFGVTCYNADCQHLHHVFNGDGTRFTCLPSVSSEEIEIYCRRCILPAFAQVDSTSGLMAQVSLLSESGSRQMTEAVQGQFRSSWYERNKGYWSGDASLLDPHSVFLP